MSPRTHRLDRRAVGLRIVVGRDPQVPTTGVEGLAWNGMFNTGYKYGRNDGAAVPNPERRDRFLASLGGQVGYVFISNGIQFLPGVDGFVNYANGRRESRLPDRTSELAPTRPSSYPCTTLDPEGRSAVRGGARPSPTPPRAALAISTTTP